MSVLPKTYQFLRDSDDLAADDALVCALEALERPYLDWAVQVLLERKRPAGLYGLIRHYHRLPAELAEQILTCGAELSGPLRRSVRADEMQTRLNGLTVARRLGCESLAYLFELALSDPEPRLREFAATSLLELARRLLGEHDLLVVLPIGRSRSEADSGGRWAGCPHGGMDRAGRVAIRREQLLRSLLAAANRFEVHLRREVVEPCTWFMPYLGEEFWEKAKAPRLRLTRLLADLILTATEPASCFFVLEATAASEFKTAACRAAGDRRDPLWVAGLGRAAQFWHPWGRIRRSWAGIKHLAWMDSGVDSLAAGFGEDVHRGWVILAAYSGLPAERKVERLAELWSCLGQAARREIIWQAGRSRSWGIPILRDAVHETTQPEDLRMACYMLQKLGYRQLVSDLARKLASDDTGRFRAVIGRLFAELALERLWNGFEALAEKSRASAVAALRSYASELKLLLRARLASSAVTDRLKAGRIVGFLNLVDELSEDMLILSQDPNPRVRSAVVKFFGAAKNDQLRDRLVAALNDPDYRVQANAIEAIEQTDWPNRVELVMPKLSSPNGRVRGNAARAMLRFGRQDEAAKVLSDLLGSPEVSHRLTGIWVVKDLSLPQWLDRLEEIAQSDISAVVRRYAASAVNRLRSWQEEASAAGTEA